MLLAELLSFRDTMTWILANHNGANYRFETTGIDTPEVVCRELSLSVLTSLICNSPHSRTWVSVIRGYYPLKTVRGVGTYHCFSAEDIYQLDTNPYSRGAIPEYLKRYVTGLLDVIRGFYDGIEEEEKEPNTRQKDREITSRLYSASYDFDMSLYDTMVGNDPNLVGVFGFL